MFEAQAIIGHAVPRDGRATATFERQDPRTSEVITRAAACSPQDAVSAADMAASCFFEWSTTAPAARAAVLERAALLLEERSDDFIAAAGAEVGATPDWVRFNIEIAQNTLRHAATLTHRIGQEPYEAGNPAMRYTRLRKPVGVVLGIAPWNAPITLAVRAVAAPLALGNTVVLKGSELCPRTHELVARALIDAGLPEGALNYVVNAPEDSRAVVEALIAHPAVRRINFTGSTRVGREVNMIAARHLKACLLELSGKAPCVVLHDADVAAAARIAAQGAFFNQGQICMSTDRAIVDERVADAFVAAVAAEADNLRHDGANDSAGQLISADAVLRVKGLIDDAVAKGAQLVTGGEVTPTQMQPTVLDGVNFGMRIYTEETFGPVLSIIRVADAEEAISVANDTDYGLAAAVHGDPSGEVRNVAARIESGVVHINGSTVYDDPALPFGGLKASGYGRFGGETAIQEFTETQFITEHRSEAGENAGAEEKRAKSNRITEEE